MSEDALVAAKIARSAAEEMTQAARSMSGSVEQLQMLWERQVLPDLTTLVERLEKIQSQPLVIAELAPPT